MVGIYTPLMRRTCRDEENTKSEINTSNYPIHAKIVAEWYKTGKKPPRQPVGKT